MIHILHWISHPKDVFNVVYITCLIHADDIKASMWFLSLKLFRSLTLLLSCHSASAGWLCFYSSSCHGICMSGFRFFRVRAEQKNIWEWLWAHLASRAAVCTHKSKHNTTVMELLHCISISKLLRTLVYWSAPIICKASHMRVVHKTYLIYKLNLNDI